MAADHEGGGVHNDGLDPDTWMQLAGAVQDLMVAEALTALIQRGVCERCARFLIYHACERIMSRLCVVGGVRRQTIN